MILSGSAAETRLPEPAAWTQPVHNRRPAPDSVLFMTPRHLLASARLCGAEASSTGQSGPVMGAWLLRASCQQARHWQRCHGGLALAVTVKLPPLGAAIGTLLAQAEAALRISGLPGRLLEVAFDEADLDDAGPDTLLLLSALRDLGSAVVLDSLACGPDALRTLRRLPVTILRLPPLLARSVAASAEARARAGRAIRAAHAIGVTTVALGVQTPLQRDILADLACDAAQGSLFGTRLAASIFNASLLS